MNTVGWQQYSYANFAEGGNLQTLHVEPRIASNPAILQPGRAVPRYFFIWTGINDVTRNLSAATVTESLGRSIADAKEAGFHVILLPLTPVASPSDQLTYGYSLNQQATLGAINEWIATEGASLADQYLNINEIPELQDPTN